jgi:hypothetical protein
MNDQVRLNAHERAHTHFDLTRQHLLNWERQFWQSRMTTAGDRADPIELVDIPTLAQQVRRTWQ